MKAFKNEIAELLGTKDKDEQEKIIKALIQAAQAPVIDIVIRYDARVDQMGIQFIGGDIPLVLAKRVLAAAQENLHQQELQATAQMAEEKAYERGSDAGSGAQV